MGGAEPPRQPLRPWAWMLVGALLGDAARSAALDGIDAYAWRQLVNAAIAFLAVRVLLGDDPPRGGVGKPPPSR